MLFHIIYGSDTLKPKRKPQGIRSLSDQTINEKSLEKNIKTEIAKEIKPGKPK